MLAHVEIGAFHPRLRLLDALIDDAMFDWHSLINVQALHQAGNVCAAEPAHKFILEGKVKTARARVALPGGASAQLVVDSARLMTLRTDHVQPTQFAHLLLVLHMLPKGLHLLGVDSIIFRRKRVRRLLPLFMRHIEGISHARALQHAVDVGQRLFGDFAAQLNINAAASHVRGDCHRAQFPGAGDNARFFVVLLGVQHLTGNARLEHVSQVGLSVLVQT